ncbi:metallophosphoesterase [Tardiphaga robiniae]|uniref:metallophosphoesterase n=1 Tax=Tardiphaga robiniae TaxID=943830 RepID=UPI0030842A6F
MVIAGDLVTNMERGVAWLLKRVSDRPVLYIPGNHEFYGCDIDRTVEKARQAAAGTNLHVLQDDAVVIDGTLFVGATLWTDFELFGNREYAMSHAAAVMNDYRKIRKNLYLNRLRPADTVARHFESRAFIERVVRETRADRRVVITHCGCVRQAMKASTETDLLSSAYTSDCPELLQHVDLWIYGHTHESRDFTINGTRIVSNAKGYGPRPPQQVCWDNPHFDPNYVINI